MTPERPTPGDEQPGFPFYAFWLNGNGEPVLTGPFDERPGLDDLRPFLESSDIEGRDYWIVQVTLFEDLD